MLPHLRSGPEIVVLSDYGGEHRGAEVKTYAFLLLDRGASAQWFSGRDHWRRTSGIGHRRMEYKKLNDRIRRAELHRFLGAAQMLQGLLVIVALPSDTSFMWASGALDQELQNLPGWKRGPAEKLLLVGHVASLFVAGLTAPGQHVTWLSDRDSIAANQRMHREATEALAHILSHYLDHELGHFRFGTADSDPGDLHIEDLIAYCDLAAGAAAEALRAGGVADRSDVSGKARAIVSWLGWPGPGLKKLVVRLEEFEGATRFGVLGFNRTEADLSKPEQGRRSPDAP